MATPGDPRREIATFLAITFLLSGLFYAALFTADTPRWSELLSAGFMWCPGLGAIASRLIHHGSLRGLGWGWGGTSRYLLGVVAVPWLLALAVYATVWLSGLGAFNADPVAAAASRFGLEGTGGTIALLALAAVSVPAGAAPGAPSTFGEELGWRGLLVPGLSKVTSFTKTSVVSGLIWSVWHYPLVVILLPIFRPGLPVWYALGCFTASVVGVSFFYTWLRQRSASVWPAVLLHASCNSAQAALERLTRDTSTTHYLTYECGIGFTIVIWLCLTIAWKRLRAEGAGPRGALPRPAAGG